VAADLTSDFIRRIKAKWRLGDKLCTIYHEVLADSRTCTYKQSLASVILTVFTLGGVIFQGKKDSIFCWSRKKREL
jgi:hypothetical protein